MIELAKVAVINGDVALNTGDVFVLACEARFVGEDYTKYNNPPIYENEIVVDLFVEAFKNLKGGWVSTLHPGQFATMHLIGEDAKRIVAEKWVLKTAAPGQFVGISELDKDV